MVRRMCHNFHKKTCPEKIREVQKTGSTDCTLQNSRVQVARKHSNTCLCQCGLAISSHSCHSATYQLEWHCESNASLSWRGSPATSSAYSSVEHCPSNVFVHLDRHKLAGLEVPPLVHFRCTSFSKLCRALEDKPLAGSSKCQQGAFCGKLNKSPLLAGRQSFYTQTGLM